MRKLALADQRTKLPMICDKALAMSREPSWIERSILRAGLLGEHRDLSRQASQSNLMAR